MVTVAVEGGSALLLEYCNLAKVSDLSLFTQRPVGFKKNVFFYRLTRIRTAVLLWFHPHIRYYYNTRSRILHRIMGDKIGDL